MGDFGEISNRVRFSTDRSYWHAGSIPVWSIDRLFFVRFVSVLSADIPCMGVSTTALANAELLNDSGKTQAVLSHRVDNLYVLPTPPQASPCRRSQEKFSDFHAQGCLMPAPCDEARELWRIALSAFVVALENTKRMAEARKLLERYLISWMNVGQ
jgi:hypothetical protein